MRQRYLSVLRRDPLDAFALERLLTLQRERDGKLDGLLEELANDVAGHPGDGRLAVLLGQVQRRAGDSAAARTSFVAALPEAPREAHLALAELERAEGELPAALEALSAALPLARDASERRELRRSLGEVCLDLGDFACAEEHYGALAGARGAGVYAVTELARALSERGHHVRAVEAYRAALKRLGGDRRVIAPVLLQLARAELDAGQLEPALESLARARDATASSPGLRHELDELLLDAYRRAGKLPELAAELAARTGLRPPASRTDSTGLNGAPHPRRAKGTFEERELLGRVYDELGEHTRALEAFRAALAASPRHADTRLRVIAILSREGRLDEVVAEYRALAKGAPREPRFVVQLVQMLMETGRRAEALRELSAALARLPRDARLWRGAYELYARWDEPDLAKRALARLAAIEPNEPAHLLALGEHELEQGHTDAAVATWRRVLRASSDRARAHATLGETLLDHDMPLKALAEYGRAVQLRPDDVELLRGRAEALERSHRSADAVKAWLEVHTKAGADRELRRESRRRVVRLWAARGELRAHAAEHERAFGYVLGRGEVPVAGAEPDLEAGRFLAEIYAAMARGRQRGRGNPRLLEAAEDVLARVIANAPGDVESMLSLERMRTLRGDVEGANAVLEQLVEADPRNARSYLARMASNALSLYRDQEAIAYAERSVALDANDAAAHTRLGDLYRARQDVERAIASYSRALELDERLYPVHFKLAELYLSRGETQQAEQLLRRVVRSAPDDDLVQRAARSAIQLGMGTDRLGELERELLPLALGHPQRPLYRRLLIELYDAITRPLVQAARASAPARGDAAGGTRQVTTPTAAVEEARAELAAIGRRAIKPLLEALSDPDPTQQRVAVDVLAEVNNPHAALPLLAMAESDAEMELRRRALRAAGAVASDALAPRLAALARGDERRLRDVAARALAVMRGPLARAALNDLGASGAPSVRGHALLGLAWARDPTAAGRARDALRDGRDPWVRGAAALALGALGDVAAQPALIVALRRERGEVAAAVAVALAVCGDAGAATPLAHAAFADEPVLQRAALLALHHLGRADVRPPVQVASERASLEPWLAVWLARLEADAVPGSLARFDRELGEAVSAALAGASASTDAALRLLEGTRSELAPGASPEQLAARGLALAEPARGGLALLVRHREPAVRASAVRLIGALGGDDAIGVLAAALGDREETVRGAALEALARGGSAPALSARLAKMVRGERSWWMRLRAVRALGAAGGPEAVAVLARTLASDGYAYVREAAAVGLGRIGGPAAREALERARQRDSEHRVRVAAARALAPGAR